MRQLVAVRSRRVCSLAIQQGVQRHRDLHSSHYFVHDAFLPEGTLLAGVPAIRHLPCTIVQGRYDIVCPPITADVLARAWPEAEYVVVPDAVTRCASPASRASWLPR